MGLERLHIANHLRGSTRSLYGMSKKAGRIGLLWNSIDEAVGTMLNEHTLTSY
jgi:hypothetical protein